MVNLEEKKRMFVEDVMFIGWSNLLLLVYNYIADCDMEKIIFLRHEILILVKQCFTKMDLFISDFNI